MSAGRIASVQVTATDSGVGKLYGQTAKVSMAVATTATADAGLDQGGIEPYHVIPLSGSEVGSPASVSQKWRLVSGPAVTITTPNNNTASYIAPGTLAGTVLTFGYSVTGSDGTTSPEDTVVHTVLPATERAVIDGVEVPAHLVT
jgi:uncharacterized membrane protein